MEPCTNQSLFQNNPNSNPWDFDNSLIPTIVEKTCRAKALGEKKPCFIVDAGQEDYLKVCKYYSESPYKFFVGYDIAKVEAIVNPIFVTAFETRLTILEKMGDWGSFKPAWKNNPSNFEMRKYINDHLISISEPYGNARIVWMFHGTKQKALDSIRQTGLANLSTTDNGYFGQGIYHTSYPDYAYRVYANDSFFQEGALILSCVSFHSAFPIIYDGWESHTGKANKSNYDAHYVLVRPENASTYYPIKTIDETYTYNELVVFQQAQTLPRYQITLQPGFLSTKIVKTAQYCLSMLVEQMEAYLKVLLNFSLGEALDSIITIYKQVDNPRRILFEKELIALGYLNYLVKESLSTNKSLFAMAEEVRKELLGLIEGKETQIRQFDQIIKELKTYYNSPRTSQPLAERYISPLLVLKNNENLDDNDGTFEEYLLRGPITSNSLSVEEVLGKKKQIMIVGPAGIGKSSLCEFITSKWAKGELWNDRFEAIIWIPLRELQNLEKSYEFTECLRSLMGSKARLYALDEYIESNKDRILFLLDGLDEISFSNEPTNIQKQFLDQCLLYPHWILTSRPYAAGRVSLPNDAIFENLGFSSEMITAYVQETLNEQADEALDKICKNQRIFNLCQIPLNLKLICNVSKEIDEMHSMTDIYQRLTLQLKRRFAERIKLPHPVMWGESDFEQNLRSKKVFAFLEEIAWNAMADLRILFSFKDGAMKKCFNGHWPQEINERAQFVEDVHHSGFLQSVDLKQSFLDNKHTFLHLTFQEFFAAKYLARLLKEKPFFPCWGKSYVLASKAITSIRCNPTYKIVLLFTAGLLKDNPSAFQKFISLLTAEDPSGYLLLLRIRCLEESGKQYSHQEWCSQLKTAKDWTHFINFMNETLGIDPNKAETYFSIIKRGLLDLGNQVRMNAAEGLRSIKRVQHRNFSSLIPTLDRLTRRTDDETKGCAWLTLGYLRHVHPEPLSLMNELIFVLKSPRGIIEKKGAIDALVKMRDLDPTISMNLKHLSETDPHSDVRAHALFVLWFFWETDHTILPFLKKIALDQERTIIERSAAMHSLGNIGRKKEDLEILSILENEALNHVSTVKFDAIKALGLLWPTHKSVAAILSKILSKTGHVKEKIVAMSALGEMAKVEPQILLPEDIEGLDKPLLIADFEKVKDTEKQRSILKGMLSQLSQMKIKPKVVILKYTQVPIDELLQAIMYIDLEYLDLSYSSALNINSLVPDYFKMTGRRSIDTECPSLKGLSLNGCILLDRFNLIPPYDGSCLEFPELRFLHLNHCPYLGTIFVNAPLLKMFSANHNAELQKIKLVTKYSTCHVEYNGSPNVKLKHKQKQLFGHKAPVLALKELQDGGTLASGSADYSIKLWDLKSRNCKMTLEGHRGAVNNLSELSNGSLVSASYDRTIKIWDPKSGKCKATLIGHSDSVNHLLMISPNVLVSASSDSTIKIWDLTREVCKQTIQVHEEIVTNLLSYRNHLLTAIIHNKIITWDTTTGDCVEEAMLVNFEEPRSNLTELLKEVALSEDDYVSHVNSCIPLSNGSFASGCSSSCFRVVKDIRQRGFPIILWDPK